MPAQKREQVFVSSTFVDLVDERQEVLQTLLEAGCIPAGMELFPASDDEKWKLIRRVIDECDYYVVVIGGRYGSVDPERGLSYTEMEYDYAIEQKKPVMAFLHGKPGEIIADKSELSEESRQKLADFRAKAEVKMVKYWTTAGDLGGQVAKSLISLRQTHPAEGWIRAGNALTPEVETELAQLRAKVAQLHAERQVNKATGRSQVEDKSGLAQGNDEHVVEAVVRYSTNNGSPRNISYDVTYTWDEIFSEVAPALLDEASDTEIQEELNRALAKRFRESEDIELPKDFNRLHWVHAEASLLNEVKVQFLALGLMSRSEKKHVASDKNSYWTLTEDGHDHMMAIRAIRRPDAFGDAETETPKGGSSNGASAR